MIIHTSLTLTRFASCRPAEVEFERLFARGSRSRERAIDFMLSGTSGRRANFGHDHEAATWDEWGVLLGRAFMFDPTAHAGHYSSAEHFSWATGYRFDRYLPAEQRHRLHRWGDAEVCVTGRYSVRTCPCGAVNRWLNFGHKFAELQEVS